MSLDRLRRRIAFEAARLIYTRQERQYGRARTTAARRLAVGPIDPNDWPCHREIRGCLRTIERAGQPARELLTTGFEADRALGRPTEAGQDTLDRFRTFELLLAPLEFVAESPEGHPEGDVLYHSLQVFEMARQQLPYDEEFLLAALLHDVGKAIDRRDHTAAGLAALADAISPRTAWLIEHHVEALALRDGALGVRTRRRLEASPDYDELTLLAQCDRQGHATGVETPDVLDALRYLRELAEACEPPDHPFATCPEGCEQGVGVKWQPDVAAFRTGQFG